MQKHLLIMKQNGNGDRMMQKKNLYYMMIINASSIHTTENRDYIRIDEQIIRTDGEINRKRGRNRRRNAYT